MKPSRINDLLSLLLNNQEQFLNYLRSKFPLFHNSNFFFRDLQFGIKSYFEKKKILLSYTDSEKLAYFFSSKLLEQGIFEKISDNCWKVNNLNFITKEPGNPFKNVHLGGN